MELSIKYSHTSITEEVLLPANLIKGLSPPNGMTSLGKQDLRGTMLQKLSKCEVKT